jgi:hypothetical protein
MAKPCNFSPFLVNFFHDLRHHSQGINLSEDWVYLDEADALDMVHGTLTLVSTCVSSLALAFLLYATSVSNVISLPSYFMRLWICS